MIELRRRIRLYREEIRATRQARDAEHTSELKTVGAIIKLWNRLKDVRDQQEFACTGIRLLVHAIEADEQEDRDELAREVEAELDEEREEFEMTRLDRVREYERQLDLIQARRASRRTERRRRRAESRLERRRRRHVLSRNDEEIREGFRVGRGGQGPPTSVDSDGEGYWSADDDDGRGGRSDGEGRDGASSSSDGGSDAERERELGPHPDEVHFDEDRARRRIEARMHAYKRRPGDPVFVPELQEASLVTPLHECPKIEQKRRKDMGNYSCYLRVLFNDKEVCKT